MNKLDIIKDGKIVSSFVKANKFLFENFSDQFQDLNKEEVLIHLWKTKFKGSLIKSKKELFDVVIFENENDLAMFLIRFS